MDTNYGLTNTVEITGVGTISGYTAKYFRVYNVGFTGITSASTMSIYGGVDSTSALALSVPLNTMGGVAYWDSHAGRRIKASTLYVNTASGFTTGFITYSTEL